MNIIKRFIQYVRNRIDLPDKLINSNDISILHISDTPSAFYKELDRIITQTKPTYIIHTGDMVDNVKLGLYPSLIKRYMHEVNKLIKILNKSNAKKVYVTAGNHDSISYLKKHRGILEILESPTVLEIEDKRFAVGHYFEDVKTLNADLYLYGHDLSKPSEDDDGKYLNGILKMHFIQPSSLDIIYLNYPAGTDDERLQKRKLKL